jgi:hypothetical protein
MRESTVPATRDQEQLTIPERRNAPRCLSNLETSCQVAGVGEREQWHACVHDLSTTGIGLILKRRFEPGTLLSFVLDSQTRPCTHSFLARVVHARPHEDGGWRLGCRLVGEIGDEELQAFGAERIKAETDKARAWVRFACQVETTCRRVGSDPEQSWPAVILDVSPGGMRLRCSVPLELDTLFSVALPGKSALNVRVRVLRVNEESDGWHIGCAFADSLGPEELAALE